MCVKCLSSLKSLEGSLRGTTLRLDDSFEGLTELTESCDTHGYGLLQGKDTDENQPREEVHGAESRRDPNMGFQMSSCGDMAAFTPFGNTVSIPMVYCQLGKFTQALEPRFFTGGSIR